MKTSKQAIVATDTDSSAAALAGDLVAHFDAHRQRCPVVRDEQLGWSVLRHADVVRVLDAHDTFSNVVSTHLSVPNGMDPPVHTEYRRIIEPYFSEERMAALEPVCRDIAAQLLSALPADAPVEVMSDLAEPFALRAQAGFLDWPVELHEPLREWVRRNHAATASGDRSRTADVAMEFDRHIRAVLDQRRRSKELGDDVASRLLREQTRGRGLTDEEIVSILRNWTVGELGTIAASVGILVWFLAQHSPLMLLLRRRPDLIPIAVDEILRIHPPLIASRRKTTCPVTLGGQHLQSGERLTVIWASANRDEQVFGPPDEFHLDRDERDNLLYGRGIHVCPGAPLARLELRVFVEELLRSGRQPRLIPGVRVVKATYPASGFSTLPILFSIN